MIYACKMGEHANAKACTRIELGLYEISIAMDDSCGAFRTMRRCDIRIYLITDGSDVTRKFFEALYGEPKSYSYDLIVGNAVTLLRIMNMIQNGDV